MLHNPEQPVARHMRRDGAGTPPHLPPPWADRHFMERCTHCMACLPACPQGVLVHGADDYPSVDYSKGSCNFCNECVRACDEHALERTHPDDPAWHRTAGITAGCMEMENRFCRSCAEQCPADAIGFIPIGAGRTLPTIQAVLCTGCGACVSHCPVDAIELHDLQIRARDMMHYHAPA